MLIQQIAPVAKTEFAPVFVALELSRSKWLVGVGAPQKWTVRRHHVEGGDLYGLLELLRRIGAEEEKRGLPVKVHVCFEAGRDGHWLHRALKLAGYEAYEIEPASVAVDRRARRAKSDGVDVDKLVRTARALCAGRARRVQDRRGPERGGRRRQAPASRI
jgi:transposase